MAATLASIGIEEKMVQAFDVGALSAQLDILNQEILDEAQTQPPKSRLRDWVVTGVTSIMLSFNTHSGGHEMFYNALLPVYFAKPWAQATWSVGSFVSFAEFIEAAPIILMEYYDNDSDKMLADLKLLTSTSPFCLNFEGASKDGKDSPFNQRDLSCHAPAPQRRRDENSPTGFAACCI